MMSKTTLAAAVAIFIAGTLSGAAADVAAQQVKWRASGSFPPGHSTAIAMEQFKTDVARLSKNTIQVDLFPNNTLGGGFEQVDQIRTGQIQMAWGGLSFYDKLVPELAAATLPFGAISESSPSSGFSAAKTTRKGAPFHGATGEDKTASSAASSHAAAGASACAPVTEKRNTKHAPEISNAVAALASRCPKNNVNPPSGTRNNSEKLGLNHGRICRGT